MKIQIRSHVAQRCRGGQNMLTSLTRPELTQRALDAVPRTASFPWKSKESVAGGQAYETARFCRRARHRGGMAVRRAGPAARTDAPRRRTDFLSRGRSGDGTRAAALRDGLQKLGRTEGINLKIEYRFGAADPARLNLHAEELVRLSPDVIVAGAAPATRAV